jgi:hypothetical protein
MPWDVVRRGEFWVVLDKRGNVVGKHPTRQKALAQQRALYANTPESKGGK